MLGTLSAFATGVLLEPTRLSRIVLWGIAAFWLTRLYFQLFVYDSKLWRDNRQNTLIHFLMIGFWAYLAVVYAGAALSLG